MESLGEWRSEEVERGAKVMMGGGRRGGREGRDRESEWKNDREMGEGEGESRGEEEGEATVERKVVRSKRGEEEERGRKSRGGK